MLVNSGDSLDATASDFTFKSLRKDDVSRLTIRELQAVQKVMHPDLPSSSASVKKAPLCETVVQELNKMLGSDDAYPQVAVSAPFGGFPPSDEHDRDISDKDGDDDDDGGDDDDYSPVHSVEEGDIWLTIFVVHTRTFMHIKVVEHYSILMVKAVLAQELNIAVRHQRLLFNDADLQDDVLLESLNMNNADFLELYVRGVGGGVRRTIKKDKKLKSQELREQAVEQAKVVQSTASLPCVRQMDTLMSHFMTLSDHNPKDALEGRFEQLQLEDLEKMYDILKGTAGGSTDFKIKKMSHIVFLPEISDIFDYNAETAGIIETAELTLSSTYNRLVEEVSSFNLGNLRALVKTHLDRKIGEMRDHPR